MTEASGSALRSRAGAVMRSPRVRAAWTFPFRLGPADSDWKDRPFAGLAIVNNLSGAGDALVTVALAGSVFVSVSLSAARGRTALGLICTVLPFAVVGPFVGPAIDRVRGGRRFIVFLAAIGRLAACLLMASWIHSLLLFPAAFLSLVCSKTNAVAKAALVPGVVDREDDLVRANSRLAVGGAVVTSLAAAFGAIVYKIFDSRVLLDLDVLVFATCAGLSLYLLRNTREPVAAPAGDSAGDDVPFGGAPSFGPGPGDHPDRTYGAVAARPVVTGRVGRGRGHIGGRPVGRGGSPWPKPARAGGRHRAGPAADPSMGLQTDDSASSASSASFEARSPVPFAAPPAPPPPSGTPPFAASEPHPGTQSNPETQSDRYAASTEAPIPPPPGRGLTRWLRRMSAFVRPGGHPYVPRSLGLASVAMAGMRAVAGFLTALVVFAFRRDGAPLIWYGLVAVASVGGNFAGALSAPRLRFHLSERLLVGGAAVMITVTAVGMTFMGLLHRWPAAIVLALVVALGASLAKTAFDAIVQRDTLDRDRSRLFARFESSFQLAWVGGALIPTLIPIPLLVGYLLSAVIVASTSGVFVAGLARQGRAWPPSPPPPSPPPPRPPSPGGSSPMPTPSR